MFLYNLANNNVTTWKTKHMIQKWCTTSDKCRGREDILLHITRTKDQSNTILCNHCKKKLF